MVKSRGEKKKRENRAEVQHLRDATELEMVNLSDAQKRKFLES